MTNVGWREGTAGGANVEAREAPFAPALLVVMATAVVHVCIAPLRRLTFDEAYYAWGAGQSVPWPIPQHPPMLGILLRATAPLHGLPIELRVRLVAVALSAATALGVARLASTLAPAASRPRAAFVGALLASWGVLPMASGIQAVPECALLAAFAWVLCIATEIALGRVVRREAACAVLALLSACALASKASALPCLAVVAASLALKRQLTAATSVALGALAALPSCTRSLIGQSAHVLGRGPWLTEGHSGALPALGAVVIAVWVVFGPAAMVIGARARDVLAKIPGGVGSIAAIAGAIVLSAVVSGRLPEVHWFAPAAAPLYAAAAVKLATAPRARLVLASHVVPTVAAVVLWCVPLASLERGTEFFAEAPHVAFSAIDDDLAWTERARRSRNVPGYGMDAWRCVYAHHCVTPEAFR